MGTGDDRAWRGRAVGRDGRAMGVAWVGGRVEPVRMRSRVAGRRRGRRAAGRGERTGL